MRRATALCALNRLLLSLSAYQTFSTSPIRCYDMCSRKMTPRTNRWKAKTVSVVLFYVHVRRMRIDEFCRPDYQCDKTCQRFCWRKIAGDCGTWWCARSLFFPCWLLFSGYLVVSPGIYRKMPFVWRECAGGFERGSAQGWVCLMSLLSYVPSHPMMH